METDETFQPYFIPEGVDFESLPAELQAAITSIVEPAYRQLVMQAKTALERSAGATLVFLLMQEILDQFEIGTLMNFAQSQDRGSAGERAKKIDRYLKLCNAKHQAAHFLLKLQQLRTKNGAAHVSPGLN